MNFWKSEGIFALFVSQCASWKMWRQWRKIDWRSRERERRKRNRWPPLPTSLVYSSLSPGLSDWPKCFFRYCSNALVKFLLFPFTFLCNLTKTIVSSQMSTGRVRLKLYLSSSFSFISKWPVRKVWINFFTIWAFHFDSTRSQLIDSGDREGFGFLGSGLSSVSERHQKLNDSHFWSVKEELLIFGCEI